MNAGVLFTILYISCFLCGPVLFAQSQGNPATGIAIYKGRTSQADEFAKAVLFTRADRFTVTTTIHITGANPLIIENVNIAAISRFDDLFTRDLLDDGDRSLLEGKKNELSQFSSRYPTSAPVLRSIIESLGTFQSDMENGQVRFRGKWITATAYQDLVKEETRVADAREKQRQAEIQDKIQRDRNLVSRRATLAGRFLLKEQPNYLATLDKVTAKQPTGSTLRLPESLTTGTLPLPRYKGREMALNEGRGLDSPAIIFVPDGSEVSSFRLAVALRVDGEDVANTADLQAAMGVLRVALPDLAEALPLCVVSARTRLQFQRGKVGAKGEAIIAREFGGHPCEILLSEPGIHDDGSMHAMLVVTVR